VHYLSLESKVPENIRKSLSDHVSATKASSDLYGFFLHCRVTPTFKDHDLFLVELAVTPELCPFQLNLFQAMVSLGGTIKYLGPPLKQPEQNAQFALRALQHRNF
jgi:hypothetical protein